MRTLFLSTGLLCFLLPAASSEALQVSDYTRFFQIQLSDVAIPDAVLNPVTDTEAVAVAPNRVFNGIDTVWITGSQGTSSFIYEFRFVPFLGPSPALVLANRVPHALGRDAEGLAYAGNDRLLVSHAPDEPNLASGVFQFDANTLTPQSFFRTDPADRPEGLGVDPTNLGTSSIHLSIADEGDNAIYGFEVDLSSVQVTLDDTFATNGDPDGFGRPEGVAVFGGDFLVADDGRDGNTGRIVQFDEDGEIVDQILTSTFGLFDPQGIDYDPVRDFIYVINDDDLLLGDAPSLLVLARPGQSTTQGIPLSPTPTPEPAAAVFFATQLVIVAIACRRTGRRGSRRA